MSIFKCWALFSIFPLLDVHLTNIKPPESILSDLIFPLYFPSPRGHSDLGWFAKGILPIPALRAAHSGLPHKKRLVAETELHQFQRKLIVFGKHGFIPTNKNLKIT